MIETTVHRYMVEIYFILPVYCAYWEYMALSAVHNLEISTASTRGIWSIFFRKYFSILQGTGSICESIHSQIDGPSSGRSSKLLSFAAGNWSTWSIPSFSNSIYFGSILRVLAVFLDSICSGYCGYCKVFRMFVRGGFLCTRGSVYRSSCSQHSQYLGLQYCWYSQYSQH